MARHIAAIVGMPGAGKSEVARFFENAGYRVVRFGDATEEELLRRGLPLSEMNERLVREDLRATHGMAAYALLNIPRIDDALRSSCVAVDGLYSWEEYLALKHQYDTQLVMVAVAASPTTRRRRLASRPRRPLTAEEVDSRDHAEIERINKGGPIAMADVTLVNEGSLEELLFQVEKAMETLV